MIPANSDHRSLLILALGLVFGPPVAFAETENFDALRPGPPPSTWRTETAGGFDFGERLPGVAERDLYGEKAKTLECRITGDSRIVAEADAPSKSNVLEISNQATDTWCVKTDVSVRDGYVEVKAKTKASPQHRFFMAPDNPNLGVVWRYQDAKNFYYASNEATNLKVKRVVDGKSELITHSHRIDATPGKWHTLRVEFTGATFRVFWDGREAYSVAGRFSGSAASLIPQPTCLNRSAMESSRTA